MPNNYNTGGNPGGSTFYPNGNPGQAQPQQAPNNGYPAQQPIQGSVPNQNPANGAYYQNATGGYPNNAFQNQNQNVPHNQYQQTRVKASELAPGIQLFISGKANFCRLSSPIEGDELVKYNQKQVYKGKQKRDKPFMQVTIENPVIHPATTDPKGFQYLQTHFYYGADGIPKFQQAFVVSPDPSKRKLTQYLIVDNNNVQQGNWFPLGADQELAKGTEITLIMSTYSGSNGNSGIRLDGVIVHGQLQLFNRAAATPNPEVLSALGITFPSAPSAENVSAPVPSSAPAMTQNPYANPVATPNPYAGPAMSQNPYAGSVVTDNGGQNFDPFEASYDFGDQEGY